MQSYPPRGMPIQNVGQVMPAQNMPANNMGFRQHHVPQVPMQHVPVQSQLPQFHPAMPQVVQNVMPMVPVGVPVMPVGVPGNVNLNAPNEHVTITPEEKKEWESAYGKKDNEGGGGKAKKKDKKFVRVAGGMVWEDQSLADWDPSKLCYQIYCIFGPFIPQK